MSMCCCDFVVVFDFNRLSLHLLVAWYCVLLLIYSLLLWWYFFHIRIVRQANPGPQSQKKHAHTYAYAFACIKNCTFLTVCMSCCDFLFTCVNTVQARWIAIKCQMLGETKKFLLHFSLLESNFQLIWFKFGELVSVYECFTARKIMRTCKWLPYAERWIESSWFQSSTNVPIETHGWYSAKCLAIKPSSNNCDE